MQVGTWDLNPCPQIPESCPWSQLTQQGWGSELLKSSGWEEASGCGGLRGGPGYEVGSAWLALGLALASSRQRDLCLSLELT